MSYVPDESVGRGSQSGESQGTAATRNFLQVAPNFHPSDGPSTVPALSAVDVGDEVAMSESGQVEAVALHEELVSYRAVPELMRFDHRDDQALCGAGR
jgi:hypothetical protein